MAAVSLRTAFEGERSAVTFWLLAFFLLVPLAIAVPGLIARNRRTYAWATLCVTPHFIYALTEIVANPAIRELAASILALSLGLAVALVAYLRLTRADGLEDVRAGSLSGVRKGRHAIFAGGRSVPFPELGKADTRSGKGTGSTACETAPERILVKAREFARRN